MLRCVISILLCLPVSPAADEGESTATDSRQIERGRMLYEIYCRSCHGEDANGQGPRAETSSPPPADLTRLRAEDGSFPAEQIHRAIDGRETVASHARTEMPIWGLTLQQLDRDSDQEDEVRGKIRSIVRYLESIQRAPDPKPPSP